VVYSRPDAMSHAYTPVHIGSSSRGRAVAAWLLRMALLAGLLLSTESAYAQVKITAVARPGAAPAWGEGMRPVDSASYYHAIECGKQGGEDPPCVFWDTGICKNDDFTLTFYSAYKQVAYTVWTAVKAKKPAPQPNYQAARQVRVTVAVAPAPGSRNALTAFALKRGGQAVAPVVRDIGGGAGSFTYDYAPWAPTSSVTLEMVGKARTVTCVIPAGVLKQFR
jgi:hypothetical protein